MTFEEFIKSVANKVGPASAFDMARDARLKAIEELLIAKNLSSKEDIQKAVEAELDRLADLINKMPQFPPPNV